MANRYEKLLNNTIIFAIGSFSSKILVLLMMRYYTGILSPDQYSVADRIVTTSNFLMPLVMLSINEAVIRFGMDKTLKKSEVFSIGLKTVFVGFLIFGIISPLMLITNLLSPYILLILAYVLFGMLKSVTAQFVRAIGLVKLFVIDGFISTATTILFNILLLSTFKLGFKGYVIATILSNIFSVIGLFVVGRLTHFVKFSNITKNLQKEMLRYSIPLIPTTMFWWITNVSDRYLVTYFCGEEINGLYAVAGKLPNMLTIVSAIFYQAWQISAVNEMNDEDATNYYSEILNYFTSALIIAGSGIIMLIKPITSILYAKAYYGSWMFAPFLVMSEVFSSLITFLGTFYMVKKKNVTVPLAIFIGALLNIVLNYIMIPKYGALAAAFTTFFSYLVAYGVRIVDVKRIIDLKTKTLRLSICLFILMSQFVLLYLNYSIMFQIAIFLVILILNIDSIINILETFILKRKRINS